MQSVEKEIEVLKKSVEQTEEELLHLAEVIDTTQASTFNTLVVTGTDRYGNVATQTVTFHVGYTFGGFASPVAAAATPYVLIMGVVATRMLMTTDSLLIAAIGPAYTAAMLMMVMVNARAFMQRKWLDIALEERQQTVSLLLREYESSDADWLWQTDAKLAFRNVSARFARAIGRGVDELEGRSLLDLLKEVPRSEQGVRRAVATAEAAFAGREPVSELVVPIRSGDAIKSIEVSARPIFNRTGRFTGYQGVGSDVTAKCIPES